MVTSVLKQWARNVQWRQLEKWRKYNQDKKEQRVAMSEARLLFDQRSIRISLTGFILGAQKIPVLPIPEAQSEDELRSDSSIFDDIERDFDEMPATASAGLGLTAPKRPDFLVVKPVVESPKVSDLDEVYSRLELRYSELKGRLQSEDPLEKQQALLELDDLMKEIAKWKAACGDD
jgi:hypothetical protein